jgi:hypothetical protein
MDDKTLDIFEAMNELYDTAQNNLILIANKQLFKNLKNSNWRDIQLSHKSIKELNKLLNEKGKELLENMQESTLNAFKVAGVKPDKTLIATNKKAMGVVIGSARQYYKGQVNKIWRLDKADDLYEEILKESQKGFEKGLHITQKGRRYEYKAYMEMKVRTTISNQIMNQQRELNLTTQNIFFIVNSFGDCADDHKNLQGKIYYDERFRTFDIPKEIKEQALALINRKKLMSMKEAIEEPYWLTTRPNCRHRFVPITLKQALGDSNALLDKLNLKRGTYKDQNYQDSQQLRYIERNIRKYKATLNYYEEIYKTGQNSKVLPYIDNYKKLIKKWQKEARLLVKSANERGYKLERDYERETRKVIVQDLGVKYNRNNGKPPMQEPEVVVKPPEEITFVTPKEKKIFDSIRNKSKENLIVYDDDGNIVYKEGGTKTHTGYNDYDYKGLHTVHNHPKGVGYYPSNQDLVTLHISQAKSMTIVSSEYTIKIIRTDKVQQENYTLSDVDIIQNAKSNLNLRGVIPSPFGKLSASQYRQKHNLTIKDINEMRAKYEIQLIKKIMEEEGYIVIIKKGEDEIN